MLVTPERARAELDRRVRAELERRRDKEPELFRAAVKVAIRAELFQRQCDVIDDPGRRIAWCCSRRAGKTEGAVRMLALSLLDSGEEEFTVFGARTLGIARDLVWRRLIRLNERYSLGWRTNESRAEISTQTGAEFRLFGVDDAASIEKVRGKKYRLVFCDESSTYEGNLKKLIQECFSPGTMDFRPRGRIVVAGTPGYVCEGFWWDIAARPVEEGGLESWSRKGWTLRDNPHIKDVEAAVAEECRDNGWTDADPAKLRELDGRWIADGDALVYAYDAKRNSCAALPEPPKGIALAAWIRESWQTTIGADIGYTDDFALVVLGSPPHSKVTYVLYAFKQAGLLAGQQADLIHEARKRFKPARTVIDAGGQGKLPLEEFNARYGSTAGGPARAAEKHGKVEAIGLLNSELRYLADDGLGTLRVLQPDAECLSSEWMRLPWENERRDKESTRFPRHASDAALYAFRAHRAYRAKPAPSTEKTPEQIEQELIEKRMKRIAAQQSNGRRRGAF